MRKIRISGKATLEELHEAIQRMVDLIMTICTVSQ